MKRTALIGAMTAISLTLAAGFAFADTLSASSNMGVLLDNPNAKAVLVKYIPDIIANPQIDQARSMTLSDLRQYVPALDEATIKKINDDLAKIK